MANMNLMVSINDDLDKVIIELMMDGKSLGHILLDQAGAEHHIKNMEKFKGLLKPQDHGSSKH